MTLITNVAKFSNNVRHVSKSINTAGSIIWQYSIVEATSKNKNNSEYALKRKLLNEILGEKLEHLSGDIPHAVMRLKAFPIIDLTTDLKSVEINVENEKKLTDYNKIIPKCDPACTPGSPGSPKKSPSPIYPCPPKKSKSGCDVYPGCKPKQCAQNRNMSTLSANLYRVKGDPIRDPSNPSTDPQDNPPNPDDSPLIPEQNPSEDPSNPDQPDPRRRYDSPN